MIRTLALRLVRYDQVTAEMAAKEGEGDKSLAFWREGIRHSLPARSFAPDMWLVFEEFERVETL